MEEQNGRSQGGTKEKEVKKKRERPLLLVSRESKRKGAMWSEKNVDAKANRAFVENVGKETGWGRKRQVQLR